MLLGVSQTTVNEVLYGLDENDHSIVNHSLVVDRLAMYQANLANKRPNVVLQDGTPVEVCPFVYQSKKGEKIFYNTLNAAHDNYYYLLDKAQRFNSKAKSVATVIKNAISRTEKKLAIQRQSVLEAESRETFKQYGDLILSNLWNIGKDTATLVCTNYYDNTEVKIPLDVNLTPQQNAQAYYKKYRKLKSSAEHNSRLVEENSALLDYLLTIKQSLRNCTEPDDLEQIRNELVALGLIREKQAKKRVETPVKPLNYDICGYNVFVGKNNVQNNFVTFKMAKPTDIWLHASKIHSSHVVIVNDRGGDVPESVIVAAAEICAYYSASSGGSKIPVDYTPRANVKRPNKAPLGFAVYNTYRTVIVNPDRHVTNVKNP